MENEYLEIPVEETTEVIQENTENEDFNVENETTVDESVAIPSTEDTLEDSVVTGEENVTIGEDSTAPLVGSAEESLNDSEFSTNLEESSQTVSANDVIPEYNVNYTITYATTESEPVEPVLFSDVNLSELTITEGLLLLIFLLLLAQFIHNLCKGSHWFKDV